MIWEIDPTSSKVSFAIRVMGITTTRGYFSRMSGQLSIDEQNPANSWVKARVDAASLQTNLKMRDNHLRSADFFDVAKYPTITFQSTDVESLGGQHYRVTGHLTMHGRTNVITFAVTYGGAGVDRRINLAATTTINRHDFGVGENMRLQFAAGPTATVELELAAVQPALEAQKILR